MGKRRNGNWAIAREYSHHKTGYGISVRGRAVRIISDWHDYYDKVLSYGMDSSVIFKRDIREENIVKLPFPLPSGRYMWWRMGVHPAVIGFCGKLYPLVEFHVNYVNRVPSPQTFCYTAEEVRNYVQMYMHKKNVDAYESKPAPRRRVRGDEAAFTRRDIEKFFNEVGRLRDKCGGFFTEHDAPIFVASSHKTCRVPGPMRYGRMAWRVEFNPCLRVWEFYRQVPHYQAFQELAMYIGAQAQPEKSIPAVPDKIMVGAKGFNERSFRKDPTKRK